MKTLLIATRNRHKTGEIAAMLAGGFLVCDLTSHPGFPEVEETGATFAENAALKAVAASSHLAAVHGSDAFVLADDSGLEVDALDGAPGVRSARFAGEGAGDLRNLELLLEKLAGVEGRAARFRCAMSIARSGSVLATFEGSCEGRIIEAPHGEHGFGYDPVFVPDGYSLTFAQLSPETKNQLSHRAQALKQAVDWLAH